MKFLEIEAAKSGIYCKSCNLKLNYLENYSQCLNFNYYCENCLRKPEVIESPSICKCEYCKNLKEIKIRSKQCSVCGYYCQGYETSECQKFLVCTSCINIELSNYTNLLIGCILEGCEFCLRTIKEKLKRCVCCSTITFNLDAIYCEKGNYYCNICFKNEETFKKILQTCKCQRCIYIFNYQNKELHQNRFEIHQIYLEDQNSMNLDEDNHKEFSLSILNDPTCSNCKKISDFALVCNHNQCFLCLIKENLHLYYEFLNNVKNKTFSSISNKFQAKCCSTNCDFNFNLPSSLILDLRIFLFRKQDWVIIDEFLPYFEGISFKFELCDCRIDAKVVCVNHELRLGCVKCINSFKNISFT
jgi:hypothetical protein